MGFNAKGKLAQGQSAAMVGGGGKNFAGSSNNSMLMQTQNGNGKQQGVSENLNDIELPKEPGKNIKAAILKVYKD